MISYTSAVERYDVYGWQVTVRPPVTDFSTLDVSGPDGFAITGAGSADVGTPPARQPGSRHRVRIQGGGRPATRRPAPARRAGCA